MPYAIAFNVVCGILFGTFPLIAGLLTGNRKYALYGFVSAVLGGTILGVLLSYPLSLVFLWLILRRRSSAIESNSPDNASETTLV
jgi:hypothetical protein